MRIIFPAAWIKVLSSLFVNLAAVWLATIFVIPNLSSIPVPISVLTLNFIYGIVYLLLAVELEKLLQNNG